MNVSSVSSTAAAQATSSVSLVQTPSPADASSAIDPSSSTTQLSKMGDLMKQLQSLATSDPDKAKSVMSSIASQLTDKANATGDSRMQALADKFSQAAQTGDMSSLQPPAQGAQGAQGAHHGGHHHHHHGGGSGGSAQSQAQSYTSTDQDPMEQVESIISSSLGST